MEERLPEHVADAHAPAAARFPRRFVRATVAGLLVAALLFYGMWYYIMPARVEALRVAPARATLEISGPGLLDARNKVVITARVQGYLKSIAVDRNDPVAEQQVLAELEAEDLDNQLVAAKADADAAQRAIAQARSEQDRAKASAEKAQSDFERKKSLIAGHIITEADWLATQAAYQETKADLARAAVMVDRAIAQAASAAANVKVLQARLDYATIRSPLNGVVVMRDRNVGDLLSPGTSLMQLVDPATIIISARFDESVMDTIEPGQTAIVRFASSPDRDFKGRVLRLIRQVDQETREFTVDITLDQLPDHWAIGQRANVLIEAPSPTPIITVPQAFVVPQDRRAGVWVDHDDRAEWVPLTLGYPAGTSMQVVKGLREGDVVLSPSGRYWLESIRVAGDAK